MGAAVVLAVVAWSFASTGVTPGSLLEGRRGAVALLRGFLPPELAPDFMARTGGAVVETLAISIAGLVLGVALGLPLALLLAGNVGLPGSVRRAAQVAAAALRGIPELLWALLFVATVGLGPAAGVCALALHGAGLLAKLCGEQLEAVDPAPVEALRLTGASRRATAALAIVPQARTGLLSLVLYQWECNIRTSTVLGFVGAGGIGQALDIALRLFRYRELATLILALLALVVVVDQASRLLRRRLGAAS